MYGLNNNTGTVYSNAENEITKFKKQTTNAKKGGQNETTFNKTIGLLAGLNNFKNSDTGTGRLMSIAQTIASFMK